MKLTHDETSQVIALAMPGCVLREPEWINSAVVASEACKMLTAKIVELIKKRIRTKQDLQKGMLATDPNFRMAAAQIDALLFLANEIMETT